MMAMHSSPTSFLLCPPADSGRALKHEARLQEKLAIGEGCREDAGQDFPAVTSDFGCLHFWMAHMRHLKGAKVQKMTLSTPSEKSGCFWNAHIQNSHAKNLSPSSLSGTKSCASAGENIRTKVTEHWASQINAVCSGYNTMALKTSLAQLWNEVMLIKGG